MLTCPVCNSKFYNKNSLANHIVKNRSLKHKKYYINNMRKKKCDGEAFHGPNCYFRGNTVNYDERRSRALFSLHPYVIRYSETEINSGEAIKHLSKVLDSIKKDNLCFYYRS